MPFAAALSTVTDPAEAFAEAAALLKSKLDHVSLALVFASPHYRPLLDRLGEQFKSELEAKAVIGCIGESIVGGDREIEGQPALSVWAAQWDSQVTVEPFHLAAAETPDGISLLGWPDSLLGCDPASTAVIALGDPYTFPARESFLPHLNEDLPGLRVIGGMSSGMSGPGESPLLIDDRVVMEGGVGVMLSGKFKLHTVVSQGCRPIGRTFVITKADRNVVIELGGKSPLEQLREMWSDLTPRDQELFQRGPHMGIVMDEYRPTFQHGDFLIRNLLGIDSKNGAMAVADMVRTGQTIQFHVRDSDSADEDLRNLLRERKKAIRGSSVGALMFTCNGRGKRMFSTPNHDAGAVQQEFGEIPLAGFFAAGEFGPIGRRNDIHGFTASLGVFEDE